MQKHAQIDIAVNHFVQQLHDEHDEIEAHFEFFSRNEDRVELHRDLPRDAWRELLELLEACRAWTAVGEWQTERRYFNGVRRVDVAGEAICVRECSPSHRYGYLHEVPDATASGLQKLHGALISVQGLTSVVLSETSTFTFEWTEVVAHRRFELACGTVPGVMFVYEVCEVWAGGSIDAAEDCMHDALREPCFRFTCRVQGLPRNDREKRAIACCSLFLKLQDIMDARDEPEKRSNLPLLLPLFL